MRHCCFTAEASVPSLGLDWVTRYPAITANFKSSFPVKKVVHHLPMLLESSVVLLIIETHHKVATPANWNDGDDCVVVPSISTEDAKTQFPKGVTEVKPYLRMTPQPNK